MSAGPVTPASGVFASGGSPLVTIKFDHAGVKYQQVLYTALTEALQSRPAATFDVVGVAPARGTAAAVQLSQSDARRKAREVMRSMGDMGVPQSRMGVSSASDSRLASSEVRVYVR
jgi:outer membrane protein OmpA-like peptidoglycan-associated protein